MSAGGGSCKECDFGAEVSGGGRVYCMRYPASVLRSVEDPEPDLVPLSEFRHPMMDAHDGCGEWREAAPHAP